MSIRKKILKAINKKAFLDSGKLDVINELSHITDSEQFAHEVFIKLLSDIEIDVKESED